MGETQARLAMVSFVNRSRTKPVRYRPVFVSVSSGYGWVITFLLTTLLTQGFVIHFSGRARLRELQERKLLEEAKPSTFKLGLS